MYDFEIFEIVSCTVDDVSKCDLRIFVEIWGICRVHLQEIDFKQVMYSVTSTFNPGIFLTDAALLSFMPSLKSFLTCFSVINSQWTYSLDYSYIQ